MEPNHIFIPSLGIYGHIDQYKGELVNSTLTLPGAYEATRWEGGSNVTDEDGDMLIAGHVAWNGVSGLIHDLAYIKAGNLAYITDGDSRQAFSCGRPKLLRRKSYRKKSGILQGLRS